MQQVVEFARNPGPIKVRAEWAEMARKHAELLAKDMKKGNNKEAADVGSSKDKNAGDDDVFANEPDMQQKVSQYRRKPVKRKL